MIYLFPLGRVIAYVAVGYALFPLLVLYFTWPTDEPLTLYSVVRTALSGLAGLGVLLYVFCIHAWRWIWWLVPLLNRTVFPDLNGRWQMRIEWTHKGKKGVKEATATIRQTFLKISMEVDSHDSYSETIVAQPKKDPESGRPILVYVFRVTPRRTGAETPSYLGSATLRLLPGKRLALAGNYFTDAESQGHFQIRRSD